MSLTGNFGFMGSTGTKGTECSSLGVIGSTGATGAVGVEPFRAIQDLFPSKHKIEGWPADVPFTTDGPATRLEFGGGAGPIDMAGVFEDYANVHTPTHTELTRQLSLLQRQNVVVEKAMNWYKREADEWKALALLMMNTKPAQPAPDVAAAMRSPHADGFGACNPLVVK